MIQYLVRFAKRLALFIPGIIIAYVSLRYTLPYFDKRLPDVVAILFTYALAAYVLIPGIIRVWRIIFPPEHLPLYCVTPDGFASDPLNIGVVGTRRELIMAMEKAGWYMSDPNSLGNIIRHVISIFLGWEYSHAPVSKLYLFGRKQDLAFEIPVNGANIRRHHVRFWATTFEEKQPITARSIHWHHRRDHLHEDELLWVGSASLDIGIMPIRHNLQLTHKVDPDTNQERELICASLRSKKLIDKTEKLKLDDPYRLINRTWRGELRTDGMMTVAWLKKTTLS